MLPPARRRLREGRPQVHRASGTRPEEKRRSSGEEGGDLGRRSRRGGRGCGGKGRRAEGSQGAKKSEKVGSAQRGLRGLRDEAVMQLLLLPQE